MGLWYSLRVFMIQYIAAETCAYRIHVALIESDLDDCMYVC